MIIKSNIPLFNNVPRIGKSMQVLEKEIMALSAKGDEETTYVYLMKYFSLVEVAKKRPEYEREKKNFKVILGSNPCWQRKMDLLERTIKSLEKRYRNNGTYGFID